MNKDFDGWNELKKEIDAKQLWEYSFKEGEIWWCSIGVNIGDEENGKNMDYERPVLIMRRFNNRVAIVLPISTGTDRERYTMKLGKGFLVLSQVRLVSSKRFTRPVRRISKVEFEDVRRELIRTIFNYF